jgi:hypothetical protein
MELLKLGFSKQTTTVRFGWTCGSNLRTLGENSMDESERGGAKTLGVRIPKVDIDHLMEKDTWCLIYNSRDSS